ncbi:MAG: NADH-quinone oxidoreductase subunit NuoF [Desulfarculaceae bacterium]|nr:NADH-quinone oxidoreductase subunit NuoF [Desulfarculaceae bacterium]
MSKISIDQLSQIQQKVEKEQALRQGQTGTGAHRMHLLICGGTGCQAAGSIAVYEALKAEIDKQGLSGEVAVIETGCNGFCALGPVMVTYPEGIFYVNLEEKDIPEVVESHCKNGEPVERLFYKDPSSKKFIPHMKEIPFFALQELIALKNRSLLDAESIDEYIGRGGYQAMAKALKEMSPEDIVAEVKKSGLRGRGGAGFPTGLKWEFCQKSPGEIKYVLCNADEGDPGAFMDRSILEADPHAVVEGMVIAAKAIGSHHGYVYCRAEYPLAVNRLQLAIDHAKEYGLLGENIMGTGFDFELNIYQGAGAFVCGEETALMRSIEGKRGMPRPRPPFPAVAGLWNRPTILNNVETWANIPQIIEKGGDWYAGIGTEDSKGTKVFALTGHVNNIGLVEVPMGTPLRTIVYDIGGGIPKKHRKFKAVQLGGPSGGCIPEDKIDTPCEYAAIMEAGAIMGSGGMIVMDDSTCMVDMARFFMDFVQEESCGKCTPCREGTRRMLQILEKICAGEGEPGDIETLEELSATIQEASLCGLGQTGPNPVLSTLRYFRDEYEAHVHDKTCPARSCVALLKFQVDEDKCKKCGMCFKNCPVDAIDWKKKEVAKINLDKCIKCKTCIENCKFDAIF